MSYKLKASEWVAKKLLNKHKVHIDEIWECFLNREKGFLEDIRFKHTTIPPTQWFIAETDVRRLLKIVFIEFPNGIFEIKTAYEPNIREIEIYEKYA